jgi:hypothetical protein
MLDCLCLMKVDCDDYTTKNAWEIWIGHSSFGVHEALRKRANGEMSRHKMDSQISSELSEQIITVNQECKADNTPVIAIYSNIDGLVVSIL